MSVGFLSVGFHSFICIYLLVELMDVPGFKIPMQYKVPRVKDSAHFYLAASRKNHFDEPIIDFLLTAMATSRILELASIISKSTTAIKDALGRGS